MIDSNIYYQNYFAWKSQPLAELPTLSVVIPAYNESTRIVPTIGAVATYCSNLGMPWELIIADDGSKDNTVAIVKKLGLANLRVLVAEHNGGKGNAVRRGILAARGDYILFADADNSTPIEELGACLQKMAQGYDIVIGSRAADGAQESNRSLLRQLMSDGLRWIVHNALRLGVTDTQCGFKLFRSETARHLCRLQTIVGFSFDLELLFLAAKFGYKVTEQPVAWVDAPGSKVDTRKEVQRFLRDIARIQLNDLQGVYSERVKTGTNQNEQQGVESCELPLSLPIRPVQAR
jgi:dolichyl-phosphate beta-glucosyltransferase